jgi:hypothetical protein
MCLNRSKTKNINLFLLGMWQVDRAHAQFTHIYSDEVGYGSGDGALVIGVIISIVILLFAPKGGKLALVNFLSLIALPCFLGLLGKYLMNDVGALVGGLIGIYLWYLLQRLFDRL